MLRQGEPYWRCRSDVRGRTEEVDVSQQIPEIPTILEATLFAADQVGVPPGRIRCFDMATIPGKRAYAKARSRTKHHCVGCGRTVSEKDFVKRTSMCARCHVRSGG